MSDTIVLILFFSVPFFIIIVIWLTADDTPYQIVRGIETKTVRGYCVTEGEDVEDLHPDAELTLKNTDYPGVIYLGVNPLTAASDTVGMFIDLEELFEALEHIEFNQRPHIT